MPCHHDCHCKRCSTIVYKRAKDHLPQSQPQSSRQTAKVLKISASDIFPILKIPSRVVRAIAGNMPAFIRIEKTESSKKYERGWNYVETRHGRLCMVRNKKDGFDLHRGGWLKTKPRERVVREVYLVEPETEPVHHRERPVNRDAGRVFINVNTPRHRRRESSDDLPPPTRRPSIQVRRPITPPPSPVYETHHPRPANHQYRYVDEADARLVQKIPVRRARVQRVDEEDTYCEEHDYDYHDFSTDGYEEVFDTAAIPTREPRPYHSSEEENSYWDDDLQAWMVSRAPKVRFA